MYETVLLGRKCSVMWSDAANENWVCYVISLSTEEVVREIRQDVDMQLIYTTMYLSI